jgi:hypothetical protein
LAILGEKFGVFIKKTKYATIKFLQKLAVHMYFEQKMQFFSPNFFAKK